MTREGTQMRNWKRNLALVGAAVVALLAATVMVDWVGDHTGGTRLAALDVLGQAAYAMEGVHSVYIRAMIRTKAHDNFELVRPDYDFVPHEMWKRFGNPPQWRIEKPARLVVMDGRSSLMLINHLSEGPTHASMGGVDTGYVFWLKPLLDVDQVLDHEMRLAQEQGSELLLTHEVGADGVRKLVVTVEAVAQGDFSTNDWARDSSIWESDNRRVYVFDAETKLLEGLEVYMHADQGDVLVLEVTEIEYNVDIDPALFAVTAPEDAIWFTEPEDLGEAYRQMGPEEVARAFFQALADEDWDEALKFMCQSDLEEEFKEDWGGLEIVSIGTAVRSGVYAGVYVPYEIRFKSGHTQNMNLAVRNDNRARRYVVDGGY
jgi:outer membrane lipoprotein-sorting protein